MTKKLQKIPALIDVHTHSRMGMEYKEDFETLTKAGIAGGYSTLWLMPNDLPVIDNDSVDKKINETVNLPLHYSIFVGATQDNFTEYRKLMKKVCGLKIYMNSTTGNLLVDNREILEKHFSNWPKGKPIFVHAEMETLDLAISLAEKYEQHLHVCHVARKYEVKQIQAAKEKGINITCEVTPHHLFLTEDDAKALGGFGKMKPSLGTKEDQATLWNAVRNGVIDMISTDHAPHTREEKMSKNPPFGVPGLETTLPLLLTALAEKRLSLEDIIRLTSGAPSKIYKIKNSRNYIIVDLSQRWTIPDKGFQTKANWSPFSGMKVRGKIRKVVIDEKDVYSKEKINI